MARGQSPYGDILYSSPHQHSSPSRRDSPARSPAQHDLYKLLDNLNLQEVQHKKVYIHQKSIFQDSLDARQRAKAETDESRIKEAHASRKSVRDDAEATLQAHIEAEAAEKRRQLEEERRRQEEEARRKAEAERRAREEEQQRAREQSEREEAAKRAAAERLRREEERRRKAAEEDQQRTAERQQHEAEQARKDAETKAEAARKRQVEDSQKAEAASAATPVPIPPSAPPTASATSQGTQADIESRHRDYLDLHRRLKKFRKDFWEQAKADKAFKGRVGDMRRNVKTHVGQLSIDGSQENKAAMAKVKNAITQSLQDTFSPPVPVNDYLPTHARVPEPSPTIPSLTIYLLSILSKAVMTVSITSYNAKAAEAPGVLVAQVFSIPALQFTNPSTAPHPSSLISILLAKFHAAAPQLFGISAPETTPRDPTNMLRLGWRREPSDDSGGKDFVPEQTHYDRLIGLGALWAAISLRNFSKAKGTNPVPPRHFWDSLALIVNTPGVEIQVGQLVLLKCMLENSVERIIQFWGATGVAVLREAVVGVHARLGAKVRGHQSAKALGLLKDLWAKERNFHLV